MAVITLLAVITLSDATHSDTVRIGAETVRCTQVRHPTTVEAAERESREQHGRAWHQHHPPQALARRHETSARCGTEGLVTDGRQQD